MFSICFDNGVVCLQRMEGTSTKGLNLIIALSSWPSKRKVLLLVAFKQGFQNSDDYN